MTHARSPVLYFRNFIFGAGDGVVSTVGLLSGIAVAGVGVKTILLTGVVLIFVEAFSMAAGSFLSESSADEYTHHADTQTGRSVGAAVIMFASYFVSGFVPLIPYILFAGTTATTVSIAVSILFLFIVGALGGAVSKVSRVKSGLRMAAVGGVAIGLGVAAGSVISSLP